MEFSRKSSTHKADVEMGFCQERLDCAWRCVEENIFIFLMIRSSVHVLILECISRRVLHPAQ